MAREMRYDRGVKLTPEERAGGGQGAGRKKKKGGGNPNVPAGAFGGEEDASSTENVVDPMVEKLFGGGGRPATNPQDTMGLWKNMMELWAQSQEPISQTLTTQKMLQDPVGWQNKMESIPGYHWNNPNGLFYNRTNMRPAVGVASQGNNATNPQNIDPTKLTEWNDKIRSSRRSYM